MADALVLETSSFGSGGSSPSRGTNFINCVMRFDGKLIPLTIGTPGLKSGAQQCDASIHSNRQILDEETSPRKRSEAQPAASSRKVSEAPSRKWISQRRSNPYKSRFESDRGLQYSQSGKPKDKGPEVGRGVYYAHD